jgi:hypothetical protein
MTRAFRGVGAVLAAAAIALFAAASVAQGRVDDGRLSVELGFMLWSLTATVAVAAGAALAVSAVIDRQT